MSRDIFTELAKEVKKLVDEGYIIPGKPIRPRCVPTLEDYDFTAKHDEGKLQIHLVPTQIIRDIAEVRMYGNAKYGDPDNWRTVEKWRYVDALFRHLLLYLDDPDGVDEESGIKHYKHAACNMAFICAMENPEEKKVKISEILDAYTQGYSDCAEQLKAYESQMKRSE